MIRRYRSSSACAGSSPIRSSASTFRVRFDLDRHSPASPTYRAREHRRATSTGIDWFQVVVGVLLSGLNPKNLALTAAAIAQAGRSGGESAVALAVFVVVGSVTVAGPTLFYVVAADKATAPLASIKQLMSDQNAVIMMVVLLVFGTKILGEGVSAVG